MPLMLSPSNDFPLVKNVEQDALIEEVFIWKHIRDQTGVDFL